MALSEVNFITLTGGLGRTLAGDDATSALVAMGTTSLADDTFVVYSLAEAEAAGVVDAGDTQALHYQVRCFFAQVAAPLYIQVSTGDYAADLEAVQSFADGTIKQAAVLATTFASADVSELQAAAEAQITAKRGLSVLYSALDFGSTTLSTLPTLASMDCENVSVVVGADAASGYPALGAALGAVAAASVAEDIAWVQKFNMAVGADFQQLVFTTGELYRNVTQAQLSTLSNKRYIFLRKYTGLAGSFFSSAATATSSTSDFATIENVRTLEKAKRGIRAALLPQLNGPLYTSGGKLRTETVAKFDLLVRNVLNQMQNESEISESSIFLNPDQNVLATSTLEVQVAITPVGVASSITVKIGFEI